MDLKTFITETLGQIVNGVHDAQKAVAGVPGAAINPELYSSGADLAKNGLMQSDGSVAMLVQFDVAVAATEGTGTKAGIGVVAAVFSLGAQGQSNQENSASSRVKFCVPLTLPRLEG